MVFLRNHHLFLLSDNISTICLHIFIFLKFSWNSSFMAKVYTNIVGSQSSGESFSSGLVYSLVWGLAAKHTRNPERYHNILLNIL